MARYTGPKTRIARRFDEPIFGSSRALSRKRYPPGIHGRFKRGSKRSEYGRQLLEKQKAKAIYGMLERQFQRFFEKASRMKGNTGENLLQLLERRLDNVVYRMGFARTRPAARQLVNHGHILVNNKSVNIPSYLVSAGDVISLSSKARTSTTLTKPLEQAKSRYPWIEVRKAEYAGTFLYVPSRAEIPENIQERLIVELYSK
ncbi:MAG: 30S ribosomal protein S4 [Bacteroidia bacterium]|nr:30S ribosomal protein S4 [Bacteroidia bacterium]MDW8235019.1 30S ribosomal protein S4 [Bacteroidia bacterium]